MKRGGWVALSLVMLASCGRAAAPSQDLIELPPLSLQSGYDFLTPDTQRLQDDAFENPGYLWVERGEALFTSVVASEPSCDSCHSDGLGGVAARYPAIEARTGSLQNLEGRINQCRIEHQDTSPLAYESDELLALTAYVANQSKGMPITVEVSERTQSYIDQGRDYFLTRRGQFNLSCQQCHTENWGQQLRGDTISQGHGNGFPAYRFEWQNVGSLHRRLRDCDTGVRAEPLPFGDPTYVALELYLATRARGLDIETPAVRR